MVFMAEGKKLGMIRGMEDNIGDLADECKFVVHL